MEHSPLFDLQIDQASNAYLSETARWAKFLAILGFITIGLLVIASLFAGTLMSVFLQGGALGALGAMGSVVFTVYMLLIALLYFFPVYYLYTFASKMQGALATNDQELLVKSFSGLKSCFKFMGILAIIVISIYVLIFLGAILAGGLLHR